MRVFVGTVVRGAPPELGGELIALDWEKKRILKRVPIFPTHPVIHDPQTRGNTRGARGIAVTRDEVFVATYHSLVGFDFDLNPTRTITNHHFAGLHEVKALADGIWVSSTSLGAALKVDYNGKLLQEWWAHEDAVIEQRFAPAPLRVDKARDNRLAHLREYSKIHVNNVDVFDGRVYVTLNDPGAIVRLFPTEVLVHDPALKGCHNGLVTEDGEIILNDSHHHVVLVFDAAHGHVKRRIDLAQFEPVRKIMQARRTYKNLTWQVRLENFIRRQRVARDLFTRGMCRLDASRILVGVSPATILMLDYRKAELLDLFQLSNCVNECVHGLEAVPALDFPYPV